MNSKGPSQHGSDDANKSGLLTTYTQEDLDDLVEYLRRDMASCEGSDTSESGDLLVTLLNLYEEYKDASVLEMLEWKARNEGHQGAEEETQFYRIAYLLYRVPYEDLPLHIVKKDEEVIARWRLNRGV